MSKTKVAIFGGSFDPIHNGHLALAREVLSRAIADEVWLMITPQNPHKQGSALSDEHLRLQMVEQAVAGMDGARACDFEFSLPRPSYTFNTLAALDDAFPEKESILLIGADNWEKFDRWYKGVEILSRYGIVVYPRGGGEQPALPAGVQWLPAKLYDISSTMIRSLVRVGKDVSHLVPTVVADFIKDKKMYKDAK